MWALPVTLVLPDAEIGDPPGQVPGPRTPAVLVADLTPELHVGFTVERLHEAGQDRAEEFSPRRGLWREGRELVETGQQIFPIGPFALQRDGGHRVAEIPAGNLSLGLTCCAEVKIN